MGKMKEARQFLGITQQELAKRSGINQTIISNLERNVVSPTMKQRLLLEAALGPIDWPEPIPSSTEFSSRETERIIQTFEICAKRLGPRAAIDLLSAVPNGELRNIAALVADTNSVTRRTA
jgi:transcriptional regulator with XRE-family HTH domain